MKKFLQFLALAALLLAGQPLFAQVRFGVKGGLASSNVLISGNKGEGSFSNRAAWQGGLLADVALSSRFSIQPALLLSSKGYKVSYPFGFIGNGLDVNGTYRPLYLEVPVLAVGKLPLGRSARLFAGLGPYVAYALSGKKNVKSSGVEETTAIRFGTGSGDELRRGDLGGSVAAGVELGPLVLGVNYNMGLINVTPGTGSKVRNTSLGLTAGLLFGSAPR
jgi:hypothetical protein